MVDLKKHDERYLDQLAEKVKWDIEWGGMLQASSCSYLQDLIEACRQFRRHTQELHRVAEQILEHGEPDGLTVAEHTQFSYTLDEIEKEIF